MQGVKLSKTQNPTTAEDRERMEVIPYASAICSIKYDVGSISDVSHSRGPKLGVLE